MRKNVYRTPTDPLWNVIHEGGPFHCRGYLKDYCERLKQTGRAELAEELQKKHPEEYKVSY